jgi:hypothetical protein
MLLLLEATPEGDEAVKVSNAIAHGVGAYKTVDA